MPWALLVSVLLPSMAGPVAVTVTPGSAAPLESTTSPWMVPVEPPALCASAAGADSATARRRNQRTRPLIVTSEKLELVAHPEADDARVEEGDHFLVANAGDAEVGDGVRVQRIEDVQHARHPAEAAD